VELSIDCPVLDREALALLEARARADLVAEPHETGGVAISCTTSLATLAWRKTSGPRRERTVVLSLDPANAVDMLLGALDDLLSEKQAAPEAGDLATPSSLPQPSSPPTPTSLSIRASRFGATGGVGSEVWQEGIGGAVGVHGGGEVRLSDSWSVVAIVGPAWGVTSADGIHAWTIRTDLRVDYDVVRRLELGLGVSGRVVWINRNLASSTQSAVTGGGLLVARYQVPLGPLALSFGPELEALARPVLVEFAGAEAFRIPIWILGFSVDATTQ
jgi:hypothetical protein